MSQSGWHFPLDTTRKLLYVYLVHMAGGDGHCEPLETFELAKVIDRNNKTTNKALRDLEGHGLLNRGKDTWIVNAWWEEAEIYSGTVIRDPSAEVKVTTYGASPVNSTIIDDSFKLSELGKDIEDIGAVADTTPHTPPPSTDDGPSKDEAGLAAEGQTQPPPEPDCKTDANYSEIIPPAPDTLRFLHFCGAFGVDNPSDPLIEQWKMLERTESKFDVTEKHTYLEGHAQAGQPFEKRVIALEEAMIEILHAVEVYAARQDHGLSVPPGGPVGFLTSYCWQHRDYQVPLADVGKPPPVEPTEAELDEKVAEMNAAGGSWRCGRRTHYKDPDTQQPAVEPLSMYAGRVMRKYNMFEVERNYIENYQPE